MAAVNKKFVDVFYIFDKNLCFATDNIKNIRNRGIAVHSLINSYGLLSKCTIRESTPATEEQILSFHSSDYVEFLKKAEGTDDLELLTDSEEAAEFNLEYDCPLFQNILDFAKIIAGGTLAATSAICPASEVGNSFSRLIQLKKDTFTYRKFLFLAQETATIEVSSNVDDASPRQKVAINWNGGWHHAQRDSAEGFCYVNDIVIGIQNLLKHFKKVLYVDLDIHHGNGVENAFAHTPHVMCVSFHKFEAGYYPGTGDVKDTGIGHGKFYTVNVPFKDGTQDQEYTSVFTAIMDKVKQVYKPDCMVVQCGADCLSGDPLGGFNLTLRSIGYCVQYLLAWDLPSVFLGGGGYNVANAARCYAFLTSVILGLNTKISRDIPDNEFFHLFGPSFELEVSASLKKNDNTKDDLKKVMQTVLDNLEKIQQPS